MTSVSAAGLSLLEPGCPVGGAGEPGRRTGPRLAPRWASPALRPSSTRRAGGKLGAPVSSSDKRSGRSVERPRGAVVLRDQVFTFEIYISRSRKIPRTEAHHTNNLLDLPSSGLQAPPLHRGSLSCRAQGGPPRSR